MFRNGRVLIGISIAAALFLSGCGGGSTNGSGSGSGGALSVSVSTTAVSLDGTDSTTLSATVQNDNHALGVSWSLSGPGTLTNTTTTSATYTAPATTTSVQTATVTATSREEETRYATTAVTIPVAPSITTSSIALAGSVGTTYSVQLAGTGGISPYTWTVSSGSTLPAGLSLSTAGVLSGTPQALAAGTTNVLFQMTDAGTPTAMSAIHTLGITISAAPAITFSGAMPASGTTNAAYSGSAAANGGVGALTYTLLSGALPTGLSLNAATGAVSGTITASGTFNYTIKAADAFGDSGTQAYQVVVISQNVIITPGAGSLAPAVTGQPYSQNLVASGGTGTGYVWTVSGLSDGFTSSANGATLTINGPATTTGTVNFTAKVVDGSNNSSGTLSYSIQAYNPLTLPAPNPVSLPSLATVNAAYTGTITASGGSGTGYTYTVTGLPANGLSSSSAGGVLTISGTPTTASPVSFGVSAKDSAGLTAGPITYTITPYASLTLPTPNPATLGPATVSTAYTGTIVVAGGSGNYSWTITGLPSDSLNYSATGSTLTISGTPGSTATVSFGVSVKDNTTNTTVGPFTYTVAVYSALSLPSPNPATLGPATISTAYTGTIVASGGSGNYSWTVTGLPSDSLNYDTTGGTLTISGTPGTATTVSFTAKLTDTTTNLSVGPFTYTVAVYNAISLPAPNPETLGSADASSIYSGTIAATGGSGNLTWTVTGLSDGLTSSPSGATLTISGTPTTAATVSFNVTLKDTSTNTTVGPYTYTITVYGALVLPPPNPVSLPGGYSTVPYTGTIVGSGGSGTYTWQVTGLSDSLASSPSGGTLTISGTPTTAATVSFNVTLTDTKTNLSITQNGYTVAVITPTPVTLPAPNPTSLPSGLVNQLYAGSIVASGGVPPYTWSINGASLPSNGAPVLIADGISVSSNGTNTLSFGGTPTAGQTLNLTNVKVVDFLSSTQTNSYTILINGTSQLTGQVTLNSGCGSSGVSVPAITVNLLASPGGTLVQTTTTDSSGNYSFSTVPDGNYTIVPSITGPSAVFYPTSQTLALAADTTVPSFSVALGYTVSGTVSYSGANTGQIYLSLNTASNCGSGALGTSIFTPGAFTIRGVPPGSYTLNAWMDLTALANGAPNTSDPSGSLPVSVSAANVTGAAVTIADNTPTTVPGSNPAIQAIAPTDQGVAISFKPITSNNMEAATSYDVQWSADPTFATATVTHNFKAVGTGSNVWILNNGTTGVTGSPFANTQTYYFEARARNAAGPASGWTVYGGSTTPTGVTVGASTSGNEVQGTVTIPAGITPTGPLYVGYFNQSTNTVYGTRIASPGSSNAFTVYVPSDSNNDYIFFEILDQNNNGLIDAGDVTNTRNNSSGIAITTPLTGQTLTLATANSTANIATQYYSYTTTTSSTSGYNLTFDVREGNKLPVAVTLLSGPNVINPVDISNYCQGCGNVQFQYYVPFNIDTPNVGDSYSFKVTYSDSSSDTETVAAAVTGWNGTSAVVGPNDAPTSLLPDDYAGLEPTFTWTDPTVDSSDIFTYKIADPSGNTVWQIPGANSDSNGLPYSIQSLSWGVDPTNASNDLAPGDDLLDSTNYTWQIQAQDSSGNQALTIEVFQASGVL